MDNNSRTRKPRNVQTYAAATHPNDDDAPIVKLDPIILREPTYGSASPFTYVEYVRVTPALASEKGVGIQEIESRLSKIKNLPTWE